MISGWRLLVTIANAMLDHMTSMINTGFIYGALVLGGIGTDFLGHAPFAIAHWIVSPRETALAVGFITYTQVAGVTISLTIANAVFLDLAQISIWKILPNVPKGDVQAAISGVGDQFPERRMRTRR